MTEEWNDLENRIEQTGKRRSQRLLDQGNRNRTHVEEDWLRDSENWVRNSEGRNYECPECGVCFFTSGAVHVHLDNEHNSPGENGNGTQEIPENAQGRPSRYGCTHCTQSFYSERLAVDHMKTHTETDGWESDGEMRSENNEQTSRDTRENNSAETEEDNMEIDGVNGGAENKGSEVTGDGNQENNSVETEEDNMEIDGVNGGAENKGSEVTGDGNEENNSVETEEDNMEIDRVNGGAENKGSEVTGDGNEENNSAETEEDNMEID